jgi:putative restriction endonuclease
MTLSSLAAISRGLPARHRDALQWFEDHAGLEVPWSALKLTDGTILATKAKGIYKPGWSEYALSVRQSLSGTYPDREPQRTMGGGWTYEYFQESLDLDARDEMFTNRGLIACWRDVVPVGVLRQTTPKPSVRYLILGPALITGWDAGYFYLEGLSPTIPSAPLGHRASVHGSALRADLVAEDFDPSQLEDDRRRTIASIVLRRGQPGFRKKLLEYYEGRCAVTEYDAEDALEAAHIIPYRGPVTNHPTNGLLLRADLHTLFDLELIAVEPKRRILVVASDIRGTRYGDLDGAPVRVPRDVRLQPSVEALTWHMKEFMARVHAGP